MSYIITYTMMTGVSERVVATPQEVSESIDALKAAGAGPIVVEREDNGQRTVLRYVPLGGDVAVALYHEGLEAERSNIRVDPSSHSVSLADARRPDFPLIYVNKGFERLTGYSPRECIGRNCRFLQGPATDPAAVRRIKAAVAAGEPLLIDLLNYRKDGSTFANRLSLKPVRSTRGQITHIVGIQSDITHVLAAQETLVGWALELARGGEQPKERS